MTRWLYRYRTVAGDPDEVADTGRRGHAPAVDARLVGVDGMMRVSADSVDYREDDVTPLTLPVV